MVYLHSNKKTILNYVKKCKVDNKLNCNFNLTYFYDYIILLAK